MRDNTDFLRKPDALSVPDNAYLVSLDVKYLYKSIPNAEGIRSVKESIEKFTSKNVQQSNNSIFGSYFNLKQLGAQVSIKHYFQIKCCDMDTICASPYVKNVHESL